MLKGASVLRAATMLLAAGAIGHFMQNNDAIASRYGSEQAHVPTPSLASGVPLAPMVLSAPVNLIRPRSDLGDRISFAAPQALPALPDDPHLTSFDFRCGTRTAARVLPGALVHVTLNAPCNADQIVQISHAGLHFTTRTDSSGALVFDLPALAREALIEFKLADGAIYELSAEVPEAADYSRAVLQWQGKTGLAIHAVTDGAPIAGALSGSAIDSRLTEHSYVARLGEEVSDTAAVAEIYSVPLTQRGAAQQVKLMVEAEITPENCGQSVSAEVLQLLPSGALPHTDLTLNVPSCAAIGDFLLLNNLLEDLKLAAN